MTTVPIEKAMEIGMAHHTAGRQAEAEAVYRQILAAQPNHFEVLHLLAALYYQMGRGAEGLPLVDRAIILAPGSPFYYNTRGALLELLGRNEEAAAAFQTSIRLKSDYADPYNNLAKILLGMQRNEQALAYIQRALELRPQYAEALNNLGNAMRALGRRKEAVEAYRKAIALTPNYAGIHYNLGNVLMSEGRTQEAIEAFQQSLRIDPKNPDAWNNLANMYGDLGRRRDAVEAYRNTLVLRPDDVPAMNNLANAMVDDQKQEEAIPLLRRALELQPDRGELHNNLGHVLKDRGDLDEALACYDRAMALMPHHPAIHSNRVYVIHFHPAFDAAALLRENRQWYERQGAPLRNSIKPHTNNRDPERKLRVGYVSPDFRDHVVGRNILPLLREHDRERFEIFSYGHQAIEDKMTEKLRPFAGTWRRVWGMEFDDLAQLIRDDGIDILVDLALHMNKNLLPVFCRKPAPVQVTFGGYPSGTGVETIDYRLTDPWLDPEGRDHFYVEKSIRLPHSFWCYDIEAMSLEQSPDPGPLPALKNGRITFGCLNNYCKINPPVVDLWRRVLDAVPNSRMMVLSPPGTHRQTMIEQLGGRVDFAEWRPRLKYLEWYQQIDLGLDSYPYNGHTTSLDSLWMGVPVVTLVGETAVSRAGWSQVCNLDLRELAAQSQDEFVQIATRWAADLDRLTQLRATLRQRMKASPLMDAKSFARGIESAYRQMWRTWTSR